MAERGADGTVRLLLAPRMLPFHLLAVLATTGAFLLGLWQYDVWHTHRDDQAATLAHAPARPLDRVMSSDAAFPRDAVGQPVRLSGRWLPQDTLFVSDKQHAGRTGFWVVTPVEVCPPTGGCANAPAILVVRGWSATTTQAPTAPSGPVDVTGWLQPGEGSGDPDPEPGDDVLPALRIADAIQHVEQDLYGGYVIARTPLEPGIAAVTPGSLPKPDSFTSLRNILYAVEWWVFGAFAVFMWVRWCRDELEKSDAADPLDGPDPQAEESQVTGVPSSP